MLYVVMKRSATSMYNTDYMVAVKYAKAMSLANGVVIKLATILAFN